ncbi:MAG: DNA polymerase III subunit alpha [Deltaproteobacteria bacterium]|jgi:DNA polymerase-3 subunit alpha|nr:DNA polymerase III subunit alpha [Deltaproteobacteria bacterium]
MSFVHLHVHSCYSLLDGAIRLNDLVKTAKDMGMPAVALTDHGQMFGLWKFFAEAKKVGIKPILGVEAYLTTKGRASRDKNETKHHLTLLAQNLTGYHNLCKMISLANIEGFYYKPRVDYELLTRYSEGVFALSGCLQGEVPMAILSGNREKAKEIALNLANIFPKRFYLEIQENGISQQALANKGLVEISQQTGIPLVATNDCHYLKKEDQASHDLLLCIQMQKIVTDPARMRMESNEFYFKSPEEMASDFAWCPEALANTLAIAEQCEIDFPFLDEANRVYHFPSLPGLSDETASDQFRLQAEEGLEKRFQKQAKTAQPFSQEQQQQYRQRLNYEVDVINQMKFPTYFLIVADFINWAREHDILVGPGRGSAVGSLVSWSLGITDVDPIRFGLIFERFLNLERISMPDIDVDFDAESRDKVIKYVTETYGGTDYVAQILTLGQMKPKAAIKAVGRALDIPLKEVDAITKMVPDKPGTTLAEVLKNPEFMAAINASPKTQKLLAQSLFMENLPHHSSTHASGVVIGPKPLMDLLPVFADTKAPEVEGLRTQVITQYDLKGVEQNGLVKFDFLGLKTLTLIKDCLKHLSQRGIELDLLELDYNDPKTYEMLRSGDCSGVFQLENEGMVNTLIQLMPTKLDDLIALVAIYRPGPLQNKVVENFIKIKNGKAQPVYQLEALKPILEETLGLTIYQEQVMLIAQVLANYTLGQADKLRQAMGKKSSEQMILQRDIFLKGAKGNNISEEMANEIFDMMYNFSAYAFNKSHSAGYAFLMFQTAYLKAHYPVEFMAALMTVEADDTAKIGKLIDECRFKGIEVLPPDINTSSYGTSVSDGQVVFGLGAIKGIGQGAIEAIIETREARPFTDLYDFCERVASKKITKKVVETLIKCGAMDKSGGAAREVLLEVLPQAMERREKPKKTKTTANLLSGLAPPKPIVGAQVQRFWPQVTPMSPDERLGYEKALLGFYVSGHPLTPYSFAIEAIRSHSITKAKKLYKDTKVTVCGQLAHISVRESKKGNKFATGKINDLNDTLDIVLFDKLLKSKSDILVDGAVLILNGKMSGDDWNSKSAPKIVVDSVYELDGALSGVFPALTVETTLDELDTVINFFAPRVEPVDSPGKKLSRVVLNIFDGKGRAFYELDDLIELSVDFFKEAAISLGARNPIKCSTYSRPYNV